MIKLLVINMNDINKELYTKFKTAYMNFITSFYNLEKGQKYSDLLHFTVSCPYFSHLTLKPAHIEKVDYEYYGEIREKFISNIKNIEYLIIHKPFNEIKHYKLPNNIIDFINLKNLSISCDAFKKFPKELPKLKKLTNIYVGHCSNLSKLGFSLEQFKNISIFFDENIYGHKYDIEASSYIIKKNNSLQFYHGPTDRSNSSRTFNGRTPVIYLQFINNIYTNLPTDLKSLTIGGIDTFNSKNISESYNSYFFDKLEYKIDLTNLPMSLETLKIICSKEIKDNIDKYVNIKLPYGCKLTFSRKKSYDIIISHEIPEHYELYKH